MKRVCLWGFVLCLTLALAECGQEFFSASSSTGPRTWFKGQNEDEQRIREFKRQQSVFKRQTLRNAAHSDSKRDLQSDLESIFNVDSFLFKKFGIGAGTADEHECFKGFSSIKNTRCSKYLKNYGPIGSTRVFNAPYGGTLNFTLRSTPSFLNVWTTPDVTQDSIKKLGDIANYLVNPSNSISLFPQTPFGQGGESVLEAECRALGPLPFWQTCSDRLNILAYECLGTTNAFANFGDVVGDQFPDPGTTNNNDNIIYFCQALLQSLNGKRDRLGRPYTLQYPTGVFQDYSLMKETVTKSAVWSASWTSTSFSQAPRQWVGTNATSGVSPIVIVHPWEEVALELTAPYDGKITSAFFGFVQDCAGVTAGKFSIRKATAPYEVITTEIVQTSQAVLCYHPGFLTAYFTQPAYFTAGQKFLLTYTPISSEKEIVKQADPYYWFSSLPTTEGPSVTKILTTNDRPEYKAVAGTVNSNVASGYNVIGRAFFEAAAVPSTCPTPAPTSAPTTTPTSAPTTCPTCPACPTTPPPTTAPTSAPATCPPCGTPQPCPSCPVCPASQKSVINVNFAGMLKK